MLRILPSLLLISVLISSCANQDDNMSEETNDSTSKKKVTIEDVERGIRANIASITEQGDGYFNFQKDSIDLSFKLVRVHTEYLSVLGQNEFFACVDLATEDGDVYDVDFFMKGTADDMTVTRTDVHKLNGKPYYTWKQNKEDKTWYTVPVKNASNELLGVIEGTDQFTFTYSVEIPDITESAQMWIPVAQSDNYQNIEIVSIEAPEYEITEEGDFNNSIMHLMLKPENSGSRISIQYNVTREEKTAYREQDPDLQKYLSASNYQPVGDRFSTIAAEVIADKQADSELTKARALYDYVIDEVRYAKNGVYGTGDANYACDSKSGNCTEFHSLFISLARSAGIPARFAVGAAIPSERNDGGVDGYHCWAEFFAEGKWWPVDISEANKYTPLATYYFGHHPANRIEFTRGRDLIPNPAPQSGPINFLAYPVFEQKGEPGLAKTKFTFNRIDPAS